MEVAIAELISEENCKSIVSVQSNDLVMVVAQKSSRDFSFFAPIAKRIIM